MQRRERGPGPDGAGPDAADRGPYTAADFERRPNEPVVLAAQASRAGRRRSSCGRSATSSTEQLCGPDAATCHELEQGGLAITTTLDMRLQAIAEKWVKAATIVPNSKDPRRPRRPSASVRAVDERTCASKDLHNGALVAMDYQTGDLVAYVGSAEPTRPRDDTQFQPQFDVLADGWRQPGSAFKPVVYSIGIATAPSPPPRCSWTS